MKKERKGEKNETREKKKHTESARVMVKHCSERVQRSRAEQVRHIDGLIIDISIDRIICK